ncbi:MAG: hypothetical protein HQL87_10945 [Magnetococcales bacterium]|nr:hypothetical protein [Magnetococcales bacterium]
MMLDTVAATQARVRGKEGMLRGVISKVSQELRAPLAAIIGAGTTLREDDGSLNVAQQRDMLEVICDEAEWMDRLIADLLELAQLEMGICRLRREWIPVEELVGSVMDCLRTRLQGRKITIQTDAKVPMLYVDPVFFTQVLVTLLDHATRHTPPGTAIAWTVAGKTAQTALCLADSGAGLSSGPEERLFETFIRGEAAGVPGAGLGLAICRGVVQMHGGTLQAMLHVTGGAEFLILLPQPLLPPDPPQDDPECPVAMASALPGHEVAPGTDYPDEILIRLAHI